ncbi:uncharacterized protein VSU04_006373 [Chlamydotis macqueenii]
MLPRRGSPGESLPGSLRGEARAGQRRREGWTPARCGSERGGSAPGCAGVGSRGGGGKKRGDLRSSRSAPALPSLPCPPPGHRDLLTQSQDSLKTASRGENLAGALFPAIPDPLPARWEGGVRYIRSRITWLASEAPASDFQTHTHLLKSRAKRKTRGRPQMRESSGKANRFLCSPLLPAQRPSPGTSRQGWQAVPRLLSRVYRDGTDPLRETIFQNQGRSSQANKPDGVCFVVCLLVLNGK